MKRFDTIVHLIFILFLSFSAGAKAAPCCAGSNAVPALITGDEAQSYSLGIAYGTVVGDAPGAGEGLPVFRDQQSAKEQKEILQFSHARLVDHDRLQAGISVPVVINQLKNAGKSESRANLGDVALTLGYEALPEWEYSLLKPRIFTFLQTTLPTGKSIYQSNQMLSSDVSSMSQFQVALGAVAIKRWSIWDATAVIKGSRIWGRSFESTLSGQTEVSSSYGLSSSIGVGYSFLDRYRLGLSFGEDYQSPVEVSSEGEKSRTSQKLLWSTGFSLTYLLGEQEALAFNYTDQTLLGISVNSSLSRTFALNYQLRLER